MSDSKKIQLISGDLEETIKEQAPREEVYSYLGFVFGIISCIINGASQFHVKMTHILCGDAFDPNYFMLYRSLGLIMFAFGYRQYLQSEFLKVSEIKDKKWLSIRLIVNYFGYMFMTFTMVYFRASTTSCIGATSPALVIIFSVFLLNEKFHMKYLYGMLIGFAGALMIVLNENQAKGNSEEVAYVVGEISEVERIFYGSFFGILYIILMSLLSVSQKKLCNENIPFETQLIYIGVSNTLMAIVYCLIFGFKYTSFLFFIMGILNGIFSSISMFFYNKSLSLINLVQCTPFFYIGTITVFALSIIFLGEPIYFTDIIGSLMILGFNVYYSYTSKQEKH